MVDDYYPARGDIVPVKDGFYYIRHSADGAPRAFGFYDYAAHEARGVAAAPTSVDVGMAVSPDETDLVYAASGPGSDYGLKTLEFDVR